MSSLSTLFAAKLSFGAFCVSPAGWLEPEREPGAGRAAGSWNDVRRPFNSLFTALPKYEKLSWMLLLLALQLFVRFDFGLVLPLLLTLGLLLAAPT